MIGKNAHKKDPSSSSSSIQLPKDVDPDDYIRFEYNASGDNKAINIAGNYRDVKNNQYSKRIILKPYSSIILMKQNR
jgi:hypothetical protein